MLHNMREIKQLQEQIEQIQHFLSPINIGLSKQVQEITTFSRIVDIGLYRQAQEIAALYHSIDTSLARQAQEITETIRSSAFIWDNSVYALIQQCSTLNLLSSHPFLTKQLVIPYQYWGNFLQSTSDHLNEAGTEQTANALKSSLILAQEQLLSSRAL